MGILYKVTATNGKYTNSDGEEKTRYVDLGVVMETKNGPMLKLEAVPVGWDGWAYLNEPKAKEGDQRQERPRRGGGGGQTPSDDFKNGTDDIPFATPYGMF